MQSVKLYHCAYIHGYCYFHLLCNLAYPQSNFSVIKVTLHVEFGSQSERTQVVHLRLIKTFPMVSARSFLSRYSWRGCHLHLCKKHNLKMLIIEQICFKLRDFTLDNPLKYVLFLAYYVNKYSLYY